MEKHIHYNTCIGTKSAWKLFDAINYSEMTTRTVPTRISDGIPGDTPYNIITMRNVPQQYTNAIGNGKCKLK